VRFLVIMLLLLFNLPASGKPTLSAGYGIFDVYRQKNLDTAMINITLDREIASCTKPFISAIRTRDKSTFVSFGLKTNIDIGLKFSIQPYLSMGRYSKSGGKDLGGTLEFRSGIELKYPINARSYIGLDFSHISNGNHYQKNPGAELLLLTFGHTL
jgi:Lipid A 3-O-deacylase (PagL)